MSELIARVHAHIDDASAPRMVGKYYAGRYTGSRFDTARELKSPDPDRFTAHDVAAVATLSVPLSGRAVVGLMDIKDELARLLEAVPPELDLADANDDDLDSIFALQAALDTVVDVGHVTRSKLLAHKRPRLVPIRDRFVLNALIGHDSGPFTRPLRDALAGDQSITKRLRDVRRLANAPDISDLRVLDVVVWMAQHGDGQVAD